MSWRENGLGLVMAWQRGGWWFGSAWCLVANNKTCEDWLEVEPALGPGGRTLASPG